MSKINDVETALLQLATAGATTCNLLFSHSEIKHGLTNEGIPQVNIDQLNPCLSFGDYPIPENIPKAMSTNVRTIWDNKGGVQEWYDAVTYKLTRGKLIKQDDWTEWQQSEFAQLDQYDAQGMFGTPVQASPDKAIFNLVWSYVVKDLDKRKKARCTCDGSTRGGQVRVLDHTYANCVDHTSSRIFYAVSAMENLLIYSADVTNAFGEAAPPQQGFYIRPDTAFRAWWKHRRGHGLLPNQTVPVLRAMQGHPEAPRL